MHCSRHEESCTVSPGQFDAVMKSGVMTESSGCEHGFGRHDPVMALNAPAEQVISSDPSCVYPVAHASVQEVLAGVVVGLQLPRTILVDPKDGKLQGFSSQTALGLIIKV